MGSKPFFFRKFVVHQDRCAMKIGTDSVLLGVFCECTNAQTILDIGTGTGILALICAQKSLAHIDAVELDDAAAGQAAENFKTSEWTKRLNLHHTRLQQHALLPAKKNYYDVIISNPPYFRARASFRIDDTQRSLARHDRDLSFQDLCESVLKLMKDEGCFWLILPAAETKVFLACATQSGLHLTARITIFSKENKAPNRFILAMQKYPSAIREQTFTVYKSDGLPTDAYREKTKDFYLWNDYDENTSLKW